MPNSGIFDAWRSTEYLNSGTVTIKDELEHVNYVQENARMTPPQSKTFTESGSTALVFKGDQISVNYNP
jgi:hypothetical protein